MAHQLLGGSVSILMQAMSTACCGAQAIVITDPLLARYVLRSKLLDKFRFLYSFLDPVRTLVAALPRPWNPRPTPSPPLLASEHLSWTLSILVPGAHLMTAWTLKLQPYISSMCAL